MVMFRVSGLLVAPVALLVVPPAPAQQAAAGVSADTAGLPLEPARIARFTTSRGTWISLDVSPDGRLAHGGPRACA